MLQTEKLPKLKLKPNIDSPVEESKSKPKQKQVIAKLQPTVNQHYHIVLPHGNSWIEVFPSLPNEIKMDALTFERIWNLHPEKLAEGLINGEHMEFPRWEQSYGQSYFYVGYLHEALAIEDPFMIEILAWVKKHSCQPYINILINWYLDGNHHIGPHMDGKSGQLVKDSSIYSFSYGQKRDFIVKSNDKSYRKVISMFNQSLIIMGGEMQEYYKHEVPKRALSTCPGRRINITMRLFK